jgi:farnesyl diphosphate synthase
VSTFATDLKSIADKTDQYLQKYFSQQKQNNQLYEAMAYGLFSGGKKIRSYVTVAAFDLFDLKEETAIAVMNLIWTKLLKVIWYLRLHLVRVILE